MINKLYVQQVLDKDYDDIYKYTINNTINDTLYHGHRHGFVLSIATLSYTQHGILHMASNRQ